MRGCSVMVMGSGFLPWLVMFLSSPTYAEQVAMDDGTELVMISRAGGKSSSRVLKQAPEPDAGRNARAGSLIVVFKPKISAELRAQTHQAVGALTWEVLHLQDAERVQISQDKVKEALATYRSRAEVLYAEADLLARAALTSNDTNFSAQWGMSKINAPQAWEVTKGSTAVRVAMLDCGIYSDTSSETKAPDGLIGHPDLRNNKVISNINFTTSTNADDLCNHGTHVAGIAASNTNNAVGVAGLGYDTKLVNVKVLGDDGAGSFSWVINGVLWAAGCDSAGICGASRRADVINMSLGAAAPCSVSLQSAIDKAWSRGLVIVAAAGNNGASGALSPGNCNNVIAVAASDENDVQADFSNFGENVDVAAPGVGIISTDSKGEYTSFSGTSMASPHVAGLAALLWTTAPYNASNQTIVDRIFKTANKSALAGSVKGRIDAAASVKGGTLGPDTISPAILQTKPLADEGGVPITTAITAGFDEDMNAATIDGSTFTLKSPSGLVKGAVVYAPTTRQATFTPLSALMEGVSYTATITTGVKDLAGNTLDSNKVWTFSTMHTTCPSPTIISHTDTKDSGAGQVRFNFDPVTGATQYAIQRQGNDQTWGTVATISTTSFSGKDSPRDPLWSVHVSAGTCAPLPGPATVFDP